MTLIAQAITSMFDLTDDAEFWDEPTSWLPSGFLAPTDMIEKYKMQYTGPFVSKYAYAELVDAVKDRAAANRLKSWLNPVDVPDHHTDLIESADVPPKLYLLKCPIPLHPRDVVLFGDRLQVFDVESLKRQVVATFSVRQSSSLYM